MSSTCARLGCALFILLSSAGHAAQIGAGDVSGTRYQEVTIAPYVLQWTGDSDCKYAFMLGYERGAYDDPLWGVSIFRNSFGDPCAYVFHAFATTACSTTRRSS